MKRVGGTTQERRTPRTPKHGLPVLVYEGSKRYHDSSGGRGDERVRSVATSTVYVYTFFILIL